MNSDNSQAASHESAAVLENSQAIHFRFVGGPKDGQVVKITSPNCSIGSAPEATFRLVCRGIEPLHCEIVRGPEGTVIRRLSNGTFLNGEVFDQEVLKPGDRIQVGRLQLEFSADERSFEASRTQVWAAERRELERELEESRQEAALLRAQSDNSELVTDYGAETGDPGAPYQDAGYESEPQEYASQEAYDSQAYEPDPHEYAHENVENATLETEEEIEYSQPGEEAPVDTASILARFGHTMEEFEEDSYAAPEPVAAEPEPFAGPETPDESNEDESIEDYMAQLMQRVGGSDEQPEVEPQASSTDSKSKSSEEAQVNAAPAEPAPEPVKPLEFSEFVPRAKAPEATSNLQSLRELANTSTRSAIDKHQRRSFVQYSTIAWFIAVVSAIVCFSMAYFSKELLSLPSLVSAVCSVISIVAVIQALTWSAKAKVGKRNVKAN